MNPRYLRHSCNCLGTLNMHTPPRKIHSNQHTKSHRLHRLSDVEFRWLRKSSNWSAAPPHIDGPSGNRCGIVLISRDRCLENWISITKWTNPQCIYTFLSFQGNSMQGLWNIAQLTHNSDQFSELPWISLGRLSGELVSISGEPVPHLRMRVAGQLKGSTRANVAINVTKASHEILNSETFLHNNLLRPFLW